ncbi:lysophospholipase, partial [Acinetobacter baumannii]
FKPKLDKIQGTVCLLHGYLEHSGIYQPIIREILEQGFSVITYDLPGHGLSNGSPASIQNFDHYQQVLMAVYQYVKHADQLPKPWVGIGQSTGGAIWMHHLLEYAEKRQDPIVDRVLLLSPLIRPAKTAWWHNPVGLGIIRRIKRQVPRHFRRNNHNPEFLRFIRLKDPLQPRMMGMDWILAMSKWMQEMEERPACRIPVWLAQGALDQTVDWRYNIEFIRRKFRLQTLLMLEEGSHQLINERADIRAALTGLIPAFLHAKPKHFYY